MVNDELRFDGGKFDLVWQRVTADSEMRKNAYSGNGQLQLTETAPYFTPPVINNSAGFMDEAARLCKFMDETALCICYCRNITAKCPGRVGRTLSCIAEDERKHLKKLRAKYFILTGGAYCPVEECPQVCTASEGLRKVYDVSANMAEQYAKAADSAHHGLANTYCGFACDEQRHAEAVCGLIESMMC